MAIHIIPLNDDEEHTEDSTCKCEPTMFEEEGDMIFVHNSFDGREGVEFANEILNNQK